MDKTRLLADHDDPEDGDRATGGGDVARPHASSASSVDATPPKSIGGRSAIKIQEAQVSVQRTLSPYRLPILVWLTVQTSIHTLIMRYSRARHVPDMYSASVAVLCTEFLKLFICLGCVLFEEGGPSGALRALNAQITRQLHDTAKVGVPALIYTIQSNLLYVAATHLDAATFMVMSQLKIFATALFSVLMLRRELTRLQWASLAVLFTGVSVVQLQSSSTSSKSDQHMKQNPLIGALAVTAASAMSGFAGVYWEKILKGTAPVSLWMRNVQLAMFAIPAAAGAVYAQDWVVVQERGWLHGFDFVVWSTVVWYGLGGLSVAVCIKYADNIAKNFATSASIILSTVASMWLFAFQPSPLFTIGSTFVIASIFLYTSTWAELRKMFTL